MSSLFAKSEADNFRQAQPLAARMRPRSLAEFAGQQHFLGEGKLLRRLLKADRLGSVIFYGPPGTGKTTLARLLATESRRFRQLSAVTSGVKELREVLEEARDDLAGGGSRTLLFIDEIHRFNKAQQDALLPDVEEGVVMLVGATTSNPFFAVNSALVSRSQIFEFQPLSPDDIKARHPAGAGRQGAGPGQSRRSHARRRPRFPGRGERRRRPPGLGGPGNRRALERRPAAGIHPRPGRRIGPAEGHAIRPDRRRRTTTRPAP